VKIPVPHEARCNRGFTLIEAVVMLILIGILAAVAFSSVSDDEAEVRAAQDKLKAHVRFTQMQAMNSQTTWGIQATGGSYYLFSDGDTTNRHELPGESELTVDLPPGFNPSFLVSFDEWGRPYDVADPKASGVTPITGPLSIGGGMTITPETGFIQ